MIGLWLLLALGLSHASAPTDTPVDPDAVAPPIEQATRASADPSAGAPSEDPDFAAIVEQAKRLYFQGRAEDAHALLRDLQVRLLLDEPVDPEASAEALVWLGEIQYKLGRTTDAREAFRLLLEQDPDYPISPYAHPMDVVGEFELVRRDVLEQLAKTALVPPPLPTVIPPAPGWVWAPLGIPQFAQRRGSAGVAFGGLQLGLGAASLGMMIHMRKTNTEAYAIARGLTEEEHVRAVRQQRWLVQFPLTAAFYGAWLASAGDARHHWRAAHAHPPAPVSVGAGRLPGGSPGIVISGGF